MPEAKLTKNLWCAAICLGLAAGTFLLYWPITHDGFTNFDDQGYIIGNSHVKSGLHWAGILWAFKAGYAANWHPLTWISHMADVQLFGMDPGGHHLMNLLFHTANTLLLFILLNNLTGAMWRSAFVATLFAWHPLHVESVAWAAERKDVLSAFFWMLTLIAYDYYVKARSSHHELAAANYILAMFFFACGLMSKPMVVTLPCVLLLLDFWPLQRFKVSSFTRLLLEKIPFFALSLAASIVTYLVQKNGGAVSSDPFWFRVLNALWAYERYIAKIFWPAGLAVIYPFPAHGLPLLGIVAAIFLTVCSLAIIFLSRQKPYLFTGWFWFLGTLVPVIGVIEVGSASMADRYTYLPSIGLFILVTWAVADVVELRREKALLPIAAIAILIACFITTTYQIRYWRNSITLFSHALQVTSGNYVADACLGQALDTAGDDKDALTYCQQAVQLDPEYPPGQFFLGTVLWNMGDTKDAEGHLSAAVKAKMHDPGFEYNMGKFLMERDKLTDAAAYFTLAISNDPDFTEAHNALGKIYLKEGKVKNAANELLQAVTLEPDNPQFHYDLGTVLFTASQTGEAISEFSNAIQLQPNFVQAHENLAVALASQGKLDQAIGEFSTVVRLQTNDPEAYFNLGFAYLNDHQPSPAGAQFTRELHLTPNETKAHYRLAQALEQQNDFTNAVAQYREALRLTPDFSNAKKELDEILAAHPELR